MPLILEKCPFLKKSAPYFKKKNPYFKKPLIFVSGLYSMGFAELHGFLPEFQNYATFKKYSDFHGKNVEMGGGSFLYTTARC